MWKCVVTDIKVNWKHPEFSSVWCKELSWCRFQRAAPADQQGTTPQGDSAGFQSGSLQTAFWGSHAFPWTFTDQLWHWTSVLRTLYVSKWLLHEQSDLWSCQAGYLCVELWGVVQAPLAWVFAYANVDTLWGSAKHRQLQQFVMPLEKPCRWLEQGYSFPTTDGTPTSAVNITKYNKKKSPYKLREDVTLHKISSSVSYTYLW